MRGLHPVQRAAACACRGAPGEHELARWSAAVERALALLVLLAVLLAAGVLAGCAGAPARAVEVRVPVPIACASAPPATPRWASDAEWRAADDYSLVMGLWLDRRLRQVYIAQLEAALAGCWQPREDGT